MPVYAGYDAYRSQGRGVDPTAKTLREIRQAERRRIPIEVALKTSRAYAWHTPIEVTIIVTNLFEKPLLINRRMLINHPRLPGEVSFQIIGPSGQRCEIGRLVTPMALRDDDFAVLPRGMSIQRTIDLSDFYKLDQKGPYNVVAFYRNDVDGAKKALTAWKGVVASTPVEITLQ